MLYNYKEPSTEHVPQDKRQFAPGHSGNPSGRPRTPEHVKEMLNGLTEKAVLALEDALDGDDPKLRLTAAQEILNRALGRPHTSASVDVKRSTIAELLGGADCRQRQGKTADR